MSDLNEIGERDRWLCWLCDKPVDPDASVNSDLGPSADSYAASKAKKGTATVERLAHRQCNTMRGKISPVVPWGNEIFVVDPSPIFEAVERLARKGGREVVARCPGQREADEATEWLLDRLARLAPETRFAVDIKQGGGQFMLSLRAG
ncbi:MAG: hypothetical protein WCO24_05885 [Actinomycetes bacterium]